MKKFLLLFVVFASLVDAPRVFAETIISNADIYETPDSVSNSFNISVSDISGSGLVLYAQVRGYYYSPHGNPSTSYALYNSGSPVSCTTESKTLSDWGFPSSTNEDDIASTDIVTLGPFSGSECSQVYSSYSGTIIQPTTGTSSPHRIGVSGVITKFNFIQQLLKNRIFLLELFLYTQTPLKQVLGLRQNLI